MKDKPTKYKYNIYVNQFAIIEHDLGIDFIEGAIFGMLQMFAHQDGCNKMMDAGKVWYKFQWKIIPQQLPTLGIKGRTACYNRMKSLCVAKMLIAHEDNQQNRCSWYTFGTKADLYNTVHQSKHSVHQNEHKQAKDVHQDEQVVHEGEQLSVHIGEHDNYTNPNYTNNNIGIPKEIGGIKTSIPENWPKNLKTATIEFLEYRQSLKKENDRIKSQKGWEGKIKQFSNMLKKHGEDDLIGAINLTISEEWKGVRMSWYFDRKTEQSNNPPLTSHQDTYTLPQDLQAKYEKGKKDFETKSLSKRISYFKKAEFQSWFPKGHNFERLRNAGNLTGQEIFAKIKSTITKLNTSSFLQKSEGCLNDFVLEAFSNKTNIKRINA